MTLNTLQYRYPGARPFTPEQQHLFFGRSKAVRELYALLQMEQLIVLYAKSGLGKSSLLNAGIVPQIERDGKLTPLNIRFNAWTEGKTETPAQITRDSLLSDYDQSNFLPKIFPDDRSLWFAAKTRQINENQSDRGIFLIFDQFEELFTYPEEQIQQFGRQFAELLQAAVPQRVRRMAELFIRAQPDLLTESEDDLLERRLNIRIVCAIRSDRMSLLDKLTPFVPQILANRYELQALAREEARAAIEEPAQKPDQYISPPFVYTPAALDTMLNYLTKSNSQPIESFQLQILCQSVEQQVLRTRDTQVDQSDVGDPEQVFRNYYDTQIAQIEDPSEQLSARRLIEEGLVYEKEQRRLTLFDVQILDNYSIREDLLRRLVDTHLLRAEPNLRGGYTYELSHDTLVAPVLKAKSKRLEAERIVAEEEAYAQREGELNAERRKRKRASQLAIAGFALSGLSIAALVFAVIQTISVQNAKDLAEQSQKETQIALTNLKREQADKQGLQLENLVQDAQVYERAELWSLALRTMQEARKIDSTNGMINQKIKQYEVQSKK